MKDHESFDYGLPERLQVRGTQAAKIVEQFRCPHLNR